MKKTTKKAKDILIGQKLFVRTVTYHAVGRVIRRAVEFGPRFVEMEGASWIADSGRFMQAIEDGTLAEVEPIRARYYVNLDTAVDVIEWKHPLPEEQK